MKDSTRRTDARDQVWHDAARANRPWLRPDRANAARARRPPFAPRRARAGRAAILRLPGHAALHARRAGAEPVRRRHLVVGRGHARRAGLSRCVLSVFSAGAGTDKVFSFSRTRPVFVVLFYVLHPHASDPTLVPGLPGPWQGALRQALFFAASAAAGCYLVHITNAYGYYAVIKQAPPVACLWVWAVMELDLPQAVLSLLVAGAYMRYKG